MKILKGLSGMFFAIAAMAMFGCGGGGGSSQPTTATLKLSSNGPVGTQIRGIEVTVVLPAGVTVKAKPSAANPAILETDPGVVVLSGATVADPAAFSQLKPAGLFTPATATAPGMVTIKLPAQSNFTLGEFVTVNTDFVAGNPPKLADFSLTGFTAFNNTGGVDGVDPITSVGTPTVTPTILLEIR